jgi:hypothetical protein
MILGREPRSLTTPDENGQSEVFTLPRLERQWLRPRFSSVERLFQGKGKSDVSTHGAADSRIRRCCQK